MTVRPKSKLPKSADRLYLGRIRSNEIEITMPGPNRGAWLRGPLPEAVTHLIGELGKTDGQTALSGDVVFAIRDIKHLVGLSVLSKEETSRIREGLKKFLDDPKRRLDRGEAMEVLLSIGDSSCLEWFRRGTLSGTGIMERSWATEGWKRLEGRKPVVEVIQKLENAGPLEIPALTSALGQLTGKTELNGFDPREQSPGGTSFRPPHGRKDYLVLQERWLKWWEDSGREWVKEK